MKWFLRGVMLSQSEVESLKRKMNEEDEDHDEEEVVSERQSGAYSLRGRA